MGRGCLECYFPRRAVSLYRPTSSSTVFYIASTSLSDKSSSAMVLIIKRSDQQGDVKRAKEYSAHALVVTATHLHNMANLNTAYFSKPGIRLGVM